MIFKDSPRGLYYKTDSKDTPADRDGACINCGKEWISHSNWSCTKGLSEQFDPTKKQYCTQSMADSILPDLPPGHGVSQTQWNQSVLINQGQITFIGQTAVDPNAIVKAISAKIQEMTVGRVKEVPTVTVTVDDWKAWRHIEPGHCACGIRKVDCDYHR